MSLARPGCYHVPLSMGQTSAWPKENPGVGSTLPSCRKEWGSQGNGQGFGEGIERAKVVILHNSCPGIVAHRCSIRTAHGSTLRPQAVSHCTSRLCIHSCQGRQVYLALSRGRPIPRCPRVPPRQAAGLLGTMAVLQLV